MGNETNQSAPQQELPAAPPQSSDSGPDLATELKGRVAALEAKILKLETEAVQSAHNRIGEIATFLRSKYPYSGL
jgi:hypothetical protein